MTAESLSVRRLDSLDGEIRVPGDKSVAHRAAFLAGLARGESRLEAFPAGADNRRTLDMIAALGARVEVARDHVAVTGFGESPREPADVVDCGNSGTTTRLGLGLLAGLPVTSILTGDDSLRRRPMARVTGPLREMGARIVGRQSGGRLPLAVEGGDLGGFHGSTGVASAQVKSALLLAGLAGGVRVELTEPAPSRDHTERFLRYLGYPVEVGADGVVLDVDGADHSGFALRIPGDPSSAAFWVALAVLDPDAAVRLPDLGWNPGRIGFFRLVGRMGAELNVDMAEEAGPEPLATLTVRGAVQSGLAVEPDQVVGAIDELPLLALMGLFVESGVRIRGAAELRRKESDRIESTAAVARALGGRVEVSEDGILVQPGGGWPSEAEIDSGGDHRIAMAAAVVALAADVPLRINGAEAVSISYPGFWRTLVEQGVASVEAVGD